MWKKWQSFLLSFVWWLVEFASADPKHPVIHFEEPRPCLEDIRNNLGSIQREISASLPCADDIQDDGFFNRTITNDRRWKKIFLKWYAKSPAYAYRLFPVTMAVIERSNFLIGSPVGLSLHTAGSELRCNGNDCQQCP